MSSIVKLDLVLISPKNLLPQELMVKVFNDCLSECNGKIVNGSLFINGEQVGKISIKERIVVQTYSENVNKINKMVKELRNLYTVRSEVEYHNYQSYLQDKVIALEKEQETNDEIQKELERIKKAEKESAKAHERQQLPSCNAIIEELKETAEQQGYDVDEVKTENGTRLQLVRRVY